jgi:hypothetical protein
VKRSRLRADPAKVREFVQRGRGQLARTDGPKRRPKRRPREGPLSPREWRCEVFRLDGGACRVSGRPGRDVDDKRFHCHHCIPKRELRNRGLYGSVWDPRNGVLLSASVHWRHEHAQERVAFEALPDRAREFASELGTWAEDLLLRLHPRRTEEVRA